ncbi:hypothetical protein BCD95_000397 [Clostridium beijerinckii]|uniref:Uncharacterized protein n=1 Tax=Clostridium beijerinckii TaxID=1520 RepID=A0AAE5H188_CLOBE|nr:hypothetical protein [Clostridium beijerinckii]OOM23060.1 hypothetical protein CLOBE_42210 [Clostridium beijerinckii]
MRKVAVEYMEICGNKKGMRKIDKSNFGMSSKTVVCI